MAQDLQSESRQLSIRCRGFRQEVTKFAGRLPTHNAVFEAAAAFAERTRTILVLLGLVIYAIVRVSLDTFYSTLGLTPEDVGLTEATILGRAGLYFGLFLVGAIAFGGGWFSILGVGGTSRPNKVSGFSKRRFEQALGDRDAHSPWAWIFCVPALLLLPLAFGIGVVFLPDELRTADFDPGSWSGGYYVAEWALFFLLLGFLVFLWAGAIPALLEKEANYAEEKRKADASDFYYSASLAQFLWPILSFISVIPFLMAYFLTGFTFAFYGPFTVILSALIWGLSLGALALTLRAAQKGNAIKADAEPRLNFASVLRLVAFFAGVAVLALVLAAEVGRALAEDAKRGEQLGTTGYGLLKLRADPVCLEEGPPGDSSKLGPYLLLGSSEGALVAFDYLRDPPSPLRIPEDNLIVEFVPGEANERSCS